MSPHPGRLALGLLALSVATRALSAQGVTSAALQGSIVQLDGTPIERAIVTVILPTSRPGVPHAGHCVGETEVAGLTVQQSMRHPFRSSRARTSRENRLGSRHSLWSAPTLSLSWCIQKLGAGGSVPSQRTPLSYRR